MSLTTTNDELPTDSHALATVDGAQVHDDEALDVGWHDRPENMPQPLIEGVGNEEMWMLVRRFNKVRAQREPRTQSAESRAANVSHQGRRHCPWEPGLAHRERRRVLARQDARKYRKIVHDSRASTCDVKLDVLLTSLQIIGLLTVAKHVARLRSWNEQRRTAAFCIVCCPAKPLCELTFHQGVFHRMDL